LTNERDRPSRVQPPTRRDAGEDAGEAGDVTRPAEHSPTGDATAAPVTPPSLDPEKAGVPTPVPPGESDVARQHRLCD